MTFIILAVLIFITIWAGINADKASAKYNLKVKARDLEMKAARVSQPVQRGVPIGGVYNRRGCNHMKTLFLVYMEDEELGEAEGMFDEEGTLLGTWACNDGDWRPEYFNEFMGKLGYNVEVSEDEALIKKLIKRWTNIS